MGDQDFTQLKRMIAEKMLTKMPDEALGELIVSMKEMLEFYGVRPSEEKQKAESATKPIAQPVAKSIAQPATQPVTQAESKPQPAKKAVATAVASK